MLLHKTYLAQNRWYTSVLFGLGIPTCASSLRSLWAPHHRPLPLHDGLPWTSCRWDYLRCCSRAQTWSPLRLRTNGQLSQNRSVRAQSLNLRQQSANKHGLEGQWVADGNRLSQETWAGDQVALNGIAQSEVTGHVPKKGASYLRSSFWRFTCYCNSNYTAGSDTADELYMGF